MRAPRGTRQQWRVGPRLVFGFALGISAFPAPAHAAPSVAIYCERLSQDERASIEARARADLAVKGLGEGAIELACADGRARVDYAAPGRTHQRRVAPEASDSKQLAEQLLALLDEVTTASLEAAASPRTTEGELPPPGEDSTAPRTTLAPRLERLPLERPPLEPRPRKQDPDPSPAAAPRSFRQLELGIGLASEFWATEVPLAVGPRLAFGLALHPELRVRLTGALLEASHRPEDIASRQYLLGTEAEWRVFERASLVAGVHLSELVVDPRADWAPTSHSSLVPGLHVRFELPVRVGSARLVLGPEIVLRSRARQIKLDDRTVLEVPAVSTALLFELRLDVPLDSRPRETRGVAVRGRASGFVRKSRVLCACQLQEQG